MGKSCCFGIEPMREGPCSTFPLCLKLTHFAPEKVVRRILPRKSICFSMTVSSDGSILTYEKAANGRAETALDLPLAAQAAFEMDVVPLSTWAAVLEQQDGDGKSEEETEIKSLSLEQLRRERDALRGENIRLSRQILNRSGQRLEAERAHEESKASNLGMFENFVLPVLRKDPSMKSDLDARCVICDGGDSCFGNLVVICDGCERGFHQKCHDGGITQAEVHADRWFCSRCQAKR
jgi:hypothetical protein